MPAIGGRRRWGGGGRIRCSTVNAEVTSWCQVEVPPPPSSDQACAASPERSPGCFCNIRDLLSSHRALSLVAPLPENVPLTPNQLGFVYRNRWNVCKKCCLVVSEDSPGSRERRILRKHTWSEGETIITFPLCVICTVFLCSTRYCGSGFVFRKPKGEIFVRVSLDFCFCYCCHWFWLIKIVKFLRQNILLQPAEEFFLINWPMRAKLGTRSHSVSDTCFSKTPRDVMKGTIN